MTFGVTPQGFNRMLESDIKSEIVGDVAPLFGIDPATTDWPNTDDPLSQLLEPFARQLGLVWEQAEAAFQGLDPAQAFGTLLDGLLALNNITRIEASPTQVSAVVSGVEGTVVPAESTQIAVVGTGSLFKAKASATITKANLLRFEVQVAGVSDTGTAYVVTINGNAISSGALGGSPTRDSIAFLLLKALNASVLINTLVEAVFYGVATIAVSSVDNLTAYTVTLDGVAYTYTSDADALNSEIIAGLVLAINNGQSKMTAAALTSTTFSLTPRNGADWVLGLSAGLAVSALSPVGAFAVKASDLETPFSGAVDSRMAIDKLYTPQAYEAIETGPVEAPAGALTVIATPVTGLTAVTNFLDGALGKDVQSDDDARILREETQATGTGHTEAIRSQLFRNVLGLTVARVYENYGDTVDAEGRPGHSVEVLAVGGKDADIARVVWDMRASGITPYGNVNADGSVDPDGSGSGITVKDSNGTDQVVHFSRPEPKYAFIQCVKTLYSEEDFPEAGDVAIQQALLAFGNTLGIGKDFLIQRFIGPAVSIPGVGSVVLQIAISDDPDAISPTYGTANIAISPRQVLVFDSSRIFVT